MNAPIALFAYNRPVHLERTLRALGVAEGAEESPVIIFSDGPRNQSDVASVEAVRTLLSRYSNNHPFLSVEVISSEANRGLARSIVNGVTRVLDRFDSVIVVEDDLEISQDALRFLNDCLSYYRDTPSVGSVTAFCPLRAFPKDYRECVFSAGRNSSQAWATWRDRWREVDWSAASYADFLNSPELKASFNRFGSDRLYRLVRQMRGEIDSWSIRFGLWQFLDGRFTIYPTWNMVKNIGYDGSGVHSGTGKPKNDSVDERRQYILTIPSEDPRIAKAFHSLYSGPWYSRAVRWLRTRYST